MNSKTTQLVKATLNQYFTSRDFNGYRITEETGESLRNLLRPLLEQEVLAARFGDLDMNPMIRPFPDPAPDVQLRMLSESNLDFVVVYPTKKELAKHVKAAQYSGMPFTLEIARGCGQLEFRCFDLSVLELYRNDPRYYYKASDVFGAIYASDDAQNLPESDRVFLQTFGFGYDDEMNREVIVFLRYLRGLKPEQQHIWNSKLLKGKFRIHPDYFDSSIRGVWSRHIPILDAFLSGLVHINEMCEIMGKPPLFRKTFGKDEKPAGFTFLIRPTKKEFLEFIHLLDKTLSENLNKKFFEGDLETEEEIPRKGAKVEVRQIGMLRLLEAWLNAHWIPDDPKPLQEALTTFKEIRKLRNIPAHAVNDNEFDQAYFKQQRDLILRAYRGLRLLRLLFA